jgi:hypothetical protein
LSHIFLPLILIYSVKRKLKIHYLILVPFTVLPDLDKFLGVVGLLHSLVTIIPICLLLVALERFVRASYEYSLIASFYVFSHLFLDVLDGEPVTFLYPFVKEGVGLIFPATLEFGYSMFEFRINNVTPQLIWEIPDPSYGNSYEILSGFGVASTILFLSMISIDKFKKRLQ